MNTGILPNMIPLLDVNKFTDGDRLFYELGTYKPTIVKSIKYKTEIGEEYYHTYNDIWTRSGNFKEIEEPLKFIESDPRFNDIEYLKHHNFMIIKSNDK